nr:hypothetical protein [Paenibacillus jamilae]
MNRMVLVFPGQGSQYLGMGATWHSGFAEADRLFEEAADILGYDLKALCMAGPNDPAIQNILYSARTSHDKCHCIQALYEGNRNDP